jgi:hypothetical protein
VSVKTYSKLRLDATGRWLSDAYKRITDSLALCELAPKYDKAIDSIRSSFYSPALAAKASTHVQL